MHQHHIHRVPASICGSLIIDSTQKAVQRAGTLTIHSVGDVSEANISLAIDDAQLGKLDVAIESQSSDDKEGNHTAGPAKERKYL